MRARSFGALFCAFSLLAGCAGQSPSAPSTSVPPTSQGRSSADAVVAAFVSQGLVDTTSMVAREVASRTITMSCPNGGTMSMTFTHTGPFASDTFTSSSRMEFTECRIQSVTMSGDPAIFMDGTNTFVRTAGGALSSLTATTRMTGGVRFDGPGGPGRTRYDCTMTIAMQIGSDGVPVQPTITSSGTITSEQPLGTVTTRSCGP